MHRRATAIEAVCFHLCALLGSFPAQAIDPTETLSELHHTSWTTRDGAPAGMYALAQSSDGYLWIGADSGLFRFDGEHFEGFTVPNGGHPIVDSVMTLLALPDNGLLIGMRFGGAFLLRDGRLTHYGEREGLPNHSVMAFAERGDGSWWAQTTVGLYRLEGGRWKQVGDDWKYPATRGDALILGQDGTLWSRSPEGTFFLLRGETAFRKAALPGGRGNFANCADGRTWVSDAGAGIGALPDATSRISNQTFASNESGKNFPGSVFCDREGGLWSTMYFAEKPRVFLIPDIVGFVKNGYRLTPEQTRVAELIDSVPMDITYSMLEDREGNMWAATHDGLERFRSNKLHSATESTPLTRPAMTVTPRGDVWLASSRFLLQFAPHRNEPLIKADFYEPEGRWDPIDNLCADRDGGAWVARRSLVRLSHYQNNTWHHDLSAQAPQGYISAIVQDQDGDLWISVPQNGLYRQKANDWILNGGLSSLPRDVPLTLIVDAQGRLWAGYVNGQVAVIDKGVARMLTNLGDAALGRVTAIAVRDERVWIAGQSTFGLYSDEHFWPIVIDGQVLTGVSGIVQSEDGDLWLHASDGISHISANDVAAFVTDHRHEVHREVINYEDGLKGSPPQITNLPSAREGGDGRVWFTTQEGAYWIDPKHVHRNTLTPPLIITSVIASGKNYLGSAEVIFPTGTPNFEVDYTALSLSMPSRVRFKYKLEGVDAGWQDVGTRRQAFYTNMSPGKHEFRVLAANEDGLWNDVGASITLTTPPMFYQTRWFYTLCGLLVLLVLWQLYRIRLFQLTKQVQGRLSARLEERERIARELHDTLLQSTQGLILLFQGFAGRLKRPDPMRGEMESALDQADELLNEARDRVVDLRTTALESDAAPAIARAGEELFAGSPVAFGVIITGTPRLLVSSVADDVYRIAREALTNAARHAQASVVEVEIAYDVTDFRLRVRDNGKGLEPSVQSAGRRARHFGLQGMRERAKKMGGIFNLWTKDRAGIEIELIVPADVAFQEEHTRSFRSISKKFAFRWRR
jgi:signal transduction histidine kinase/ligand-binding sensor domain-containing protein